MQLGVLVDAHSVPLLALLPTHLKICVGFLHECSMKFCCFGAHLPFLYLLFMFELVSCTLVCLNSCNMDMDFRLLLIFSVLSCFIHGSFLAPYHSLNQIPQ